MLVAAAAVVAEGAAIVAFDPQEIIAVAVSVVVSEWVSIVVEYSKSDDLNFIKDNSLIKKILFKNFPTGTHWDQHDVATQSKIVPQPHSVITLH